MGFVIFDRSAFNLEQMNIGFDAKRAFLNFTGLGNYSRFVIDALQKNYKENRYILYSPRTSQHPEAKVLHQFETDIVLPDSSLLKGSLWRTYGIQFEKSVSELHLYHGLSGELPVGLPPKIKKVVTIHDLIFLRYPELYHPIDRFIYKVKAMRACRQAEKIIAVSEQTKQDIVDFFKISASKIQVVYQGCHASFRKEKTKSEIDSVRLKYHLPNDYILNVGTIEKRKNLGFLINAVSRLPKELPIKLVVVGKQTAYFKEMWKLVLEKDLKNKVIFLHQVAFSDLPAIYQGAKVFVYPSRFEGFGIPIVEAIESNVPVITSTGSCFNEAGGPDSIYVDPDQPDDLAFQLKRILEGDSLVKTMTMKSKSFAKKFHPEVIATDLVRTYNSIL